LAILAILYGIAGFDKIEEDLVFIMILKKYTKLKE